MDYLLKSTICMTAFYGLYFFGFRRMSFHTLNRFYLLASLVLSLTIPLISYERTEIVVLEPQPIEEVLMPTEEIQENTYAQAPVTQPTTNLEVSPKKDIDWLMLLNAIYLVGVWSMFMVFCKNILLIVYRIKNTASTSLNHRENLKILLTKSQSNSSFFNYIFLNPENLNPHEQELIIAHESFHAQRLHTLDLLFSSILKAIFWFNPIVYFYQKSLKQIHEYEVDALMSATYDGREYAHLLLKLSVAPNAMIMNQFSTKPLSERIQFLFKTPTHQMKKLLYFLSLPIIVVGVMAFAEEKVVRVYQEKTPKSSIPKSVFEGKILAEKVIAKQTYNDTLKNTKINKIDSSRFSYNTNVKVPKNKVDSFNVITNQEYLVEGRDYVVKNNVIFLNSAYKNTKIAYRLYMKPLGSIVYPELTKLNKVDFPDMRFASKTPIFWAKTDSKTLPQISTSPSYFSKLKRNQDTLRTILETNKLGKNPLVFINGEEYPSSVLYRINPDAVSSIIIPRANSEELIKQYGEKAKDGVVRIGTKKNVDFILKNDKEYQVAIENTRKQIAPIEGKIRRVLLKDFKGKVTEKVSLIDTKTGLDKFSFRTEVGKKAIFFIDNVLVSEADVNNYQGELYHGNYKNKEIEEKYPKEVKSADIVFNLKSRPN